MTHKLRKIIPKFHKKLSGFLSDEGGKISKEDVLKMGMIAMGVATTMPDLQAASHNSVNPGIPYPGAADATNHNNYVSGPSLISVTQASCVPVNRVVNGHLNYTPSVSIAGGQYQVSTHGSHSSHGSHGSHGQW